jgi:hypothetical protein
MIFRIMELLYMQFSPKKAHKIMSPEKIPFRVISLSPFPKFPRESPFLAFPPPLEKPSRSK